MYTEEGDGESVDKDTQFTWNKALSIDPANTWYILKLSGNVLTEPVSRDY